MKKLICAIIPTVMAASIISPVKATATGEKYIPSLYFRAENSENVNVIFDNLVHISPEVLENGDYSLNVGVYIKDENKCISAISAKWRSSSEYVTLENIVDPRNSTGISKQYTTSDGRTFTTDLTPFCYGAIEEDGTMDIPYTLTALMRTDDDVMAFTYEHISMSNLAPLEFLGASSDEYSFTSFDAVIDRNTPDGVHKLVFNTKENFSTSSADICHGQAVITKTNFYSFNPSTIDMNIVTGYFMLGDLNESGNVDALDASNVLTAYANAATSSSSGLDEKQTLVADVDNNGSVNAIDASQILSYYAYIATDGAGSLQDYMSK